MRALPLGIGTIHFTGIGGIGMSGIAEVLHTLGYAVQGSDISESANVKRLREVGIPVAVGHDPAHVANAQVVVVSTAVRRDNPEVMAARARLVPVVRRAEMLAELMRLRWSVAVGGTRMAKDGGVVPGYDETPVVAHMKGREVEITVDIGLGRGKARVWTCDLTHGYIDINGSYRS